MVVRKTYATEQAAINACLRMARVYGVFPFYKKTAKGWTLSAEPDEFLYGVPGDDDGCADADGPWHD